MIGKNSTVKSFFNYNLSQILRHLNKPKNIHYNVMEK